MDREQIRAIFEEMATISTCPKCGHKGMRIVWRQQDVPRVGYPLSGTLLEGQNEIPHLECLGCGVGADGNVPL